MHACTWGHNGCYTDSRGLCCSPCSVGTRCEEVITAFHRRSRGRAVCTFTSLRRVPDHPHPRYSTDKILCFFKGPDRCTSLRQSFPYVFIVCSEANFSKLLSEESRHEGEVFTSVQNEMDIILSFYRHTLSYTEITRSQLLSLYKCSVQQNHHYPPERICVNCIVYILMTAF